VTLAIVRKPGSGPGLLYWRNETSGVLAKAVSDYLGWGCQRGPEPTPLQCEALRVYFEQWIAFDWHGLQAELEKLREAIKAPQTPGSLRIWILQALDLGIDPL